MRAGMLVVGILLLIVGIVLWYLPVQPSATTQAVPTGEGAIISANPPLAVLTSSLSYNANWSASSTVTVNVYDCGTDTQCTNAVHTSPIATGTGASGSLSWSGPKGEVFLVVPSSTATVTTTVTEPLLGGVIGVVLLVIGILLAAIGAMRAPKKAAPAAPVARAAAPAAPPAAPPTP